MILAFVDPRGAGVSSLRCNVLRLVFSILLFLVATTVLSPVQTTFSLSGTQEIHGLAVMLFLFWAPPPPGSSLGRTFRSTAILSFSLSSLFLVFGDTILVFFVRAIVQNSKYTLCTGDSMQKVFHEALTTSKQYELTLHEWIQSSEGNARKQAFNKYRL